MLKKIALIFVCLFMTLPAYGAWTFNSACTYLYEDYVGGERLFYMECDLNSDGSAETAIDIMASFQANTAVPAAVRNVLDEDTKGGVLYAIQYKQGTTAPDNDFLLTVYNGGGFPIFSETLNYDEAGQGIVGGYYSGDTTEGHYPAIQGGLTIDVADIGGSGDDIILQFIFLIKR